LPSTWVPSHEEALNRIHITSEKRDPSHGTEPPVFMTSLPFVTLLSPWTLSIVTFLCDSSCSDSRTGLGVVLHPSKPPLSHPLAVESTGTDDYMEGGHSGTSAQVRLRLLPRFECGLNVCLKGSCWKLDLQGGNVNRW
jgi:hypothetical protein